MFKILLNTTDISNYVLDFGETPISLTTYDNIIEVPSGSMTVLDQDITYAVGDVIQIQSGAITPVTFARFVIKNIETDIGTTRKILTIEDAISLMADHKVMDLTNTDFYNAILASPSEDYVGAVCQRFYNSYDHAPYRRNFVTLTHVLKVCLMKAGVIPLLANIDVSAYYGNLPSGFLYYYDGNSYDLYYDHLAFHPGQLQLIGRTNQDDYAYNSATLLQIFLFIMQVFNAEYIYSGNTIIIRPRVGLSFISDDHVYGLKSTDYVNAFDFYQSTLMYWNTNGVGGFDVYEPSEDIYGTENNQTAYSPSAPPSSIKPKLRVNSMLKHAIVHRRGYIDPYFYIEEMDYVSPSYHFIDHYTDILLSRFPALPNTCDTLTTDFTPSLSKDATNRILLEHTVNFNYKRSTITY